MKNYFIIHGSFGHNKENWFPWLENKLKEQGFEVFNFNYPTPQEQNFENWSKVLDSVRDKINEESIFVCHSIAPIFLIKYILSNKIKIRKLISVCGFNNYIGGHPEFDNINKFMFVNDVSNFKNLCKERICFYSKDDPYIKFENAHKFAQSIDAKEIIYINAGHFNERSGFLTFEDIIKYL
ncbi:MAG: alpha/beta hydrolase [Clostridia bacterium]|nr:alpha/beta hydrolase [Clostridia bacterium]